MSAAEHEATETGFAAIIDADTLADVIEPVSVLVDECKIHLNEAGLAIRAVDPANVGMVDLELDADAFESYAGADGGVIGLPLERLEDILDMADAGQVIQFELNEETRKLHVDVGGLAYTMALIDPDSIRDEPDIPDLDLPAEVTIEGRDINRSVKASDLVSDHIALGVNEGDEEFYVEAEGDTDDVHLTLDRDDCIALTPGAAHSLFSLDYLKDMNKAIPSDAEVTLELGEEFPVKLHFAVADGDAAVIFLLAPRIQNS